MEKTIEKIDIRSLDYKELQEEMTRIGEKAFRGKQIYEWLHVKLADSFQEMTNLSRILREKLEAQYVIRKVDMLEHQISKKDPTEKFLFELEDGNVVESVLMKYNYGNSVCISSQVGCRMGCKFCASTIGGKVRNLTTSEMLGQVSDEHGLHISQRNITASTCGIVPNIKRLAEEKLQITLALSLHGSSQEKRQELMPIAYQYDLSEVLAACEEYFEKTGRRITFEYSLVQGVNDTAEDAARLIKMLGHMNCHMNLIPVNPIKERAFQKPSRKNAEEFKNKLEHNGINVTIRRERGSDIDGACGQLRRRHITSKKEN